MILHKTLSLSSITKNIYKSAFSLFIAFFTLSSNSIMAQCWAKIEAGPTYLHLDVLESGHTIKEINMGAVKADASFMVWKGITLKPSFLYGRQGHSEIASGGCGIGQYIPLGDKCSITPSIGCNFTQFKTNIHLPIPPMPGKLKLEERFRSVSPYVSLDASYCFAKGWRILGIYQYVWSQSWTKIKGLEQIGLEDMTTKSHPKGSNYALVLERDLNDHWSVSLGAAYNLSLTKEKHGLRAAGVRLGLAYWF